MPSPLSHNHCIRLRGVRFYIMEPPPPEEELPEDEEEDVLPEKNANLIMGVCHPPSRRTSANTTVDEQQQYCLQEKR